MITLLLVIQMMMATDAYVKDFGLRKILQNKLFLPCNTELRMSPFPDASEIAKQQRETYQSLHEYHEGNWRGKAKSFLITDDVMAGILDVKEMSYQTSIGIRRFEEDNDAYGSLQETLSWDDHNNTKITIRETLLSESMDVDSVDSSYSCDLAFQKGDLPSDISGTHSLVKFGIEHCLAVSDYERMRCFLLYGVEDELIRVVICDESKLVTEKNLDDTSIIPDDRMEQLQNTISSSTTKDAKEVEENNVRRVLINLFSLVSGVWLGDGVIRDHSLSHLKKKKNINGFAKWSMGVQKLTTLYTWDYQKSIQERNTFGRCIGAALSSQIPNISVGNVIDTSYSRTKRIQDRMTLIDFELATYVTFVSGSVLIKAPRILSFSHVKDELQPFYTEFAVFQKSDNNNVLRAVQSKRDVNEVISQSKLSSSEIVCSKLTRFYDSSGRLSQGASSFFTRKEIDTRKKN